VCVNHSNVHTQGGEQRSLAAQPANWSSYLDYGPVASEIFMENVEKTPPPEFAGVPKSKNRSLNTND